MQLKKTTTALFIFAIFGLTALGSWAYTQAADSSPSPLTSSQIQPKNFRGGMMGMGRGMGFHQGQRGAPWKMKTNKETQALFDELRAAQQDGDEDRIVELREELKTQFEADRETREARMDAAIKGGYESWKTFVTEEGMPVAIFSTITEENFDKFVQLHELRKEARDLEEELGLNEMGMHHMKI